MVEFDWIGCRPLCLLRFSLLFIFCRIGRNIRKKKWWNLMIYIFPTMATANAMHFSFRWGIASIHLISFGFFFPFFLSFAFFARLWPCCVCNVADRRKQSKPWEHCFFSRVFVRRMYFVIQYRIPPLQ